MIGKDLYYMSIAQAVAGVCELRWSQGGKVVVLDDRIMTTRYDGAPFGDDELPRRRLHAMWRSRTVPIGHRLRSLPLCPRRSKCHRDCGKVWRGRSGLCSLFHSPALLVMQQRANPGWYHSSLVRRSLGSRPSNCR